MNNIAMLQKEKKLNKKELGAILGVEQNTICNWENGKREPDFLSLEKMASYFHCSIDYLLGRTDQKETPTARSDGQLESTDEELNEVLERYRTSPEYRMLFSVTKNATNPNDDGTFEIYINSKLCASKQKKCLKHELQHIRQDHFYNDILPIEKIERQADGFLEPGVTIAGVVEELCRKVSR